MWHLGNLGGCLFWPRRSCKAIGSVTACLLIGWLIGCGGGGEGGAGATLKIVAQSPGVQLGATQQFKADLFYSNRTMKDVTSSVQWSSANAAVAQVNSTGLVTPVAPGKSTIQATLNQPSLPKVSGSSGTTVTELFGVTQCCPSDFVVLAPSAGSSFPPLQVGDITTGFTAASTVDPVNHLFYIFQIQNGTPSMVAN